ncbi:hypothetical protein OAU50_01440 [Planctomycetota bacterium]|nr:hypothetical protein [Planctomycetota bacterium]
MSDKTFATVLNCMDGRVQLQVNEAVKAEFGVEFVDTITEAGIVRFVSENINAPEAKATLGSIRISLDKHGSRNIAVVAHHDCAGNPISEDKQKAQVTKAVDFLKTRFPDCTIKGMWVNSDWAVEAV